MPLGLLALGSWLEGRHVVIVDGRFELAPEARVVELARNALLLGVSVRTGEPLREALRVSRAARAASPQLPVVWGGPHVLLDPESLQYTAPLFYILYLFAHLLYQHFQFHRVLRGGGRLRFGGQGVGFPIELLHQKVQSPTTRSAIL